MTQDKIQDLQEMAKNEYADISSLLEAAYTRGEIAGLKRGQELALEALRQTFPKHETTEPNFYKHTTIC